MSNSDLYILAMPAIAAGAVLLTGVGLAVFLKRQSRDGKKIGAVATGRSNRGAQYIVDGVWVHLTKAQIRTLARVGQPVRIKRRAPDRVRT
jgi:hypothetical protein